MMSRVEVLDVHGNVIETVLRHRDPGTATMCYVATFRSKPDAHVRLVEGDALPGMPENVIAERFGNPCDAPCCVPLADAWPEQDLSRTRDSAAPERERK